MAIKRLPSTGDAPRATGVPGSVVPGGAADSAGYSWAGRTFDHHETAFADDDGRTPEAYAAAVAEVRAAADALQAAQTVDARDAALARLAAAHSAAVAALAGERVLVPLVAEAGEIGETVDGRIVEKSQELSIVTVAGPDGRRVMPVFSSTEAMRAWNPESRPIPVPAPQAALAAAQEQTDLIIIDPGAAATEYGVRRTMLRAIAEQTPFTPAWADGEVEAALLAGVADEPALGFALPTPGDPEGRLMQPEVDVIVGVAPGLAADELREIVGRAQQRWAQTPVIAERADSMRVRIVPAGEVREQPGG